MIRLLRRHPVRDGDLSTYVDGRLSSSASRRIEAHVQGCERCRSAVAELRALKSMLSSLPAETPQRSFVLTPAMAAQEPRSIATSTPRRPSFMLAPAAALAALVLLLGVDLLAFNDNGAGGGATDNFAALQDKSMERSSAGVQPTAAASVPSPAAAPMVQSPVPATAGGAGVQPTPGAATMQAEGPSITAPGATAPEVRAPTDASASRPVSEDRNEGQRIVRVLEVVAAGALVLSLSYVFWRVRSAPGP